LINSAHDISEGVILCALAECCIINESRMIGLSASIPVKTREDFSLFSESQSRIIISVSPAKQNEIEGLLLLNDMYFSYLGTIGGIDFAVNNKLLFDLEELRSLYYSTIPSIMNG
jgi:phosphoribosylformylglycinamidine synthase